MFKVSVTGYGPHPPAPLPKGEGRVSRRIAGHFSIMALTPGPSPKGRGESTPKICRSFLNYGPHPPAPLPKGEGRVSRRFAGHFTGCLIIALTPSPSPKGRGESKPKIPGHYPLSF